MVARKILSRARQPDAKIQVRESFIAIGRALYVSHGAEAVSLRRIADEAGYAPSTIHRHFKSRDDLMLAIREQDMVKMIDEQEAFIEANSDPAQRLRGVLLIAARHWLAAHPDHYQLLLGASLSTKPEHDVGKRIEEAPTTIRSNELYNRLTADLAASHPNLPPVQFATATLVAITYGVVGFVLRAPTLDANDAMALVSDAIEVQIAHWKSPFAGGPRYDRPLAQRTDA